jgi:hypothetical protein
MVMGSSTVWLFFICWIFGSFIIAPNFWTSSVSTTIKKGFGIIRILEGSESMGCRCE